MILLDDARKEIINKIAEATTDWQSYHLPRLKMAVEREMRAFQVMYNIEMEQIQNGFWRYGQKLIDDPLQMIGFYRMLPAIDPTVLSIMQGYSADLITGLSGDAIKRINTELNHNMLGQQTPYQAMKAIGTNLDSPGVFRTIAKRAEVITRTEGSRVLEAAHHARRENAAQLLPRLKKIWKHGLYVKNPRQGHLDADARNLMVDWDKPFYVSSTLGGTKEPMMYPKDLSLGASAANTINCDCYSLDYHPAWDEVVVKQNDIVMEMA